VRRLDRQSGCNKQQNVQQAAFSTSTAGEISLRRNHGSDACGNFFAAVAMDAIDAIDAIDAACCMDVAVMADAAAVSAAPGPLSPLQFQRLCLQKGNACLSTSSSSVAIS